MATTVVTEPDAYSGARKPLRFVCTNDIYDVSTNSEAVSAVANNGSGKCRYSIATHNFKVGDVLTGSTFTPATTYNVRQTVTATNAVYVDTDVDFDVNDTGTLTRINDNFQMKGVLTVSGSVIATLYVKPDSSGNFVFDVQKYLRSQFTRNSASFSAQGITTPNTGTIKTYSVEFTGQHDDVNGLLTNDNDGGQASTLTLKAIDFDYGYLEDHDTDDYLLAAGLTTHFLTNAPLTGIDLRDDEAFHLSFIENVGGFVYFRYQTWNGTAWSVTTSIGYTVNAGHGIISVYNLFAENSKIKCWITDFDLLSPVAWSDEIIFNRTNKCTSERFYFKNLRGGYDLISFTGESDKTLISNKESFQKGLDYNYTIGDRGDVVTGVEEYEQRTATMEYKSNAITEWVSEIITSEDVYILSGTNLIPVLITSTGADFYNSLNMSLIQIKYRIINR